jgi:3-dehydroquinate synthase
MSPAVAPVTGLERLTLHATGEVTHVVLGHDLARRTAELFSSWRDARLLVVSDSVVGPLHAEGWCAALRAQGHRVHAASVPAGEEGKTLESLARLYAAAQGAGLERHDAVVAVGGGAVGDVAGMLAGTYLRGLDLVQVPTTLVALVTASVGGKVGVNFGGAKNLVGLFKQPALVLGDLDALRTLPRDEFLSGLGELVTVGVLGSPEVFEALETRGVLTADDTDALQPLIAAAIACKGELVEADPFDRTGVRARLNLGHTFGHAFETVSGFTFPHGLAVAVGLHAATLLAARHGLCAPALVGRVHAALAGLGLPSVFGGARPDEVLAAMRHDKKKSGGRLRLVLPRRVGEVALVDEDELAPGDLEAVLAQVTRPAPGRESRS